MSKKPNIKKSYNRILQISEDAQQITLPDSRYYRRNGEYYPSVTYVLSYRWIIITISSIKSRVR